MRSGPPTTSPNAITCTRRSWSSRSTTCSARAVEKEYSRLYEDIGLGLTTWSPLASGLLSGKYLDGIPEDSRAALAGYEWLGDRLLEGQRQGRALAAVAEEIDCHPGAARPRLVRPQPDVSSVITGASKVEQVVENMRAIEVLSRLTDKTMERIAEII